MIAPAVMIFAHDAGMRLQVGYTRIAPVRIGARVYIGAAALILPGTVIGDDAVIAAGAVVKGEVPPGAVVAGNPAAVIGDVATMAERHRQNIEASPCWPYDGWSLDSGITAERRQEQRRALLRAGAGYVAGRSETAAPRAPDRLR